MRFELRSVHVPGDGNEQCPLASLSEDDAHVHGELIWWIGDRQVPHMGFWGPRDVCLGEWLDTLTDAVTALASEPRYVHDSGEQGVPAFVFERECSVVHLSLVAGVGGGEADPEWQQVAVKWEEFVPSVQQVRCELKEHFRAAGLSKLSATWEKRFSESAE